MSLAKTWPGSDTIPGNDVIKTDLIPQTAQDVHVRMLIDVCSIKSILPDQFVFQMGISLRYQIDSDDQFIFPVGICC